MKHTPSSSEPAKACDRSAHSMTARIGASARFLAAGKNLLRSLDRGPIKCKSCQKRLELMQYIKSIRNCLLNLIPLYALLLLHPLTQPRCGSPSWH